MSPSSTADDTGGYGAFGAGGLAFAAAAPSRAVPDLRERDDGDAARLVPGAGRGAARGVANIETLLQRYPDVYTHDGGFYDALDPGDRLGRAPPARARSVDDHGRAGQRA